MVVAGAVRNSHLFLRQRLARLRTIFRKFQKLAASMRFSSREWMNLPSLKRTTPKELALVRSGACSNIGSLISRATHMRHQEPYC